jgi:hypothetical protein
MTVPVEPPAGPPAEQPAVPVHVVAAWQQAEAQLLPSVMGQPDHYQRAVLLLGATLGRLRRLGPDIQPLLDAADSAGQLVAEVAEQERVNPLGLDLPLIGQTALAMRHREVVAEQAAARRRDALANARERGLEWVVLEDFGDPAGDPFRPYRRLEAHAGTGRAVLATTRPDETFQSSQHTVSELRIDVDTGQVTQTADDPDETPDAASRDQRVREMRDRISGPR